VNVEPRPVSLVTHASVTNCFRIACWGSIWILAHMKAVQILMDEELIAAVDQEAKRRRSDRSKLVRTALTRYLADSRRGTLEQQHIHGYQKRPQRKRDLTAWERAQQWPEE
jgi:hypothetical protein